MHTSNKTADPVFAWLALAGLLSCIALRASLLPGGLPWQGTRWAPALASVLHPGGMRSGMRTVQTIELRAETAARLRDEAEALRARLLQVEGVTAVRLVGLNQTRLAVEYAPRRLARSGLTPADLRAVLPVDEAQTRPGHLALRSDTALDVQAVADLRLKGTRLGDVALVVRDRLEPPVSTLSVDGQPAVEVVATVGHAGPPL